MPARHLQPRRVGSELGLDRLPQPDHVGPLDPAGVRAP
jgi:hypothetical protein